MRKTMVNVHEAKTHFSRLLARVEKGERITVARNGRPVARLVAVEAGPPGALPAEDPLLNLDEYGFDGPGGPLLNETIDRTVYGH